METAAEPASGGRPVWRPVETQSDVRLVRTLTRAARRVTAKVEPVLKSAGLTLDQWLVIDALAAARGSTMTELAAATLVTGPTLTRVTDRLVLTAVAYREVDPADRRRVRVYLSSRGRATHRKVTAKLADLEQTLVADIADPHNLLHTLTHLAD